MFTVHLGSDPVVVLYGHDVVKEALVDRADEFAARGHMPIGDRANNGLGMFADQAPLRRKKGLRVQLADQSWVVPCAREDCMEWVGPT